jgi:hypothetical protein
MGQIFLRFESDGMSAGCRTKFSSAEEKLSLELS